MRVFPALFMMSAIASLACGGSGTAPRSGESTAETGGDEQARGEGPSSSGSGSGTSDDTLASEAEMLDDGSGRGGPSSSGGAPGGAGRGIAGGSGPRSTPPTARQREAQAALQRALDKASDAAEGDGSTCEKAYRSTRALVESLRDEGMVRDNAELAPQKRFVSACEELPNQMQQCMLVAYAQSHPQQCVKARNELDAEKVKMIRDMMGPPTPEEGTTLQGEQQ